MWEEEFEEWFETFKKEDPEHRDNFWYVLMKPFIQESWKASRIKTLEEIIGCVNRGYNPYEIETETQTELERLRG